MPGFICIGIGDQDSLDTASQHSGRDLPMDRYRPVAKLGGADCQMIAAVRQKIDPGFGTMFGGWRAIEHADGDSLPLQPFVPLFFGFAASAGQGVLCPIQTFLETVTTDHDVARAIPNTQNCVSRTNHVLSAKLDRIHLQFPGQLIHRALDAKTALGDSITPECSRGNDVCVDGVPVRLFVRAAVESNGFVERMAKDFSTMVAVSPGVGNSSQINGGQSALPLDPKFHSHLVRMPGGGSNKLFGTRKLPFYGPMQIQCGKRA